MKKFLKFLRNFVFFVILMVGVGAVLWHTLLNPRRGTVKEFENSRSLDTVLSSVQAEKDLKVFWNSVKGHHPAFLDGSKEKTQKMQELYESHLARFTDVTAEKNGITILELWRACSQILNVLHDGHTSIFWKTDDTKWIHDITQLEEYGLPVAVDSFSTEELLEKFKNYNSYETDYGIEQSFYNEYLFREDTLRLCGVDTSDGVVFKYKYEIPQNDGISINAECEYLYQFVSQKDIIRPKPEEKEFVDVEPEEKKWVYYTIDKESSLGIFTLESCIYNQEYCDTLKSFFDEVFEYNIQNIAVDLRNNGGGSSYVANEFMKYIDVDGYNSWGYAVRYGPFLIGDDTIYIENQKAEKTFSGDLFILTNVKSYSSAMDFAMVIADNDLGYIVGEPSGNKPEGYGDCLFFMLPNSKLCMSVSFKIWKRIDQTKKDKLIECDYPCDPNDALREVYRLILE